MLPRERVMMALNHQQPDRVPVEYSGVMEMTISMMDHFKIDRSTPEKFWAGFGEVSSRFHTDVMDFYMSQYIGPELPKFEDGSFMTDKGFHHKKVANEFQVYDEYAGFPLADCETIEELEQYAYWPKAENYDFKALVESAREAHKYYATRCWTGGPFENAWGVRGLEQFLIDMVLEPEIAHYILKKYTDFYLEYIDRLVEAGGAEVFDIVFTHDDIATQQAMMMSMEMWEEFIKPCHVKIDKKLHEHGFKVEYHSCGNIWNEPLINGLIDMGVDILNPLQMCGSWGFAELKEKFGDRLCFCGGINIQTVLPNGTEEEVRAYVRNAVEIMGKNGGYICGPSHFFQNDCPPQNLVAMYEEATGEKVTEE